MMKIKVMMATFCSVFCVSDHVSALYIHSLCIILITALCSGHCHCYFDAEEVEAQSYEQAGKSKEIPNLDGLSLRPTAQVPLLCSIQQLFPKQELEARLIQK